MKKGTFLSQWAAASAPAAQSKAKQHEFSIYVPPLLETLAQAGARNIVDFQADEGFISVAFCDQDEGNHATFVMPGPDDDPDGVFRDTAEKITKQAVEAGQVRLTACSADIEDAQADAILFNNILGCQGCLENVEEIVKTAARVLKEGGYALVTVPNPDGGTFSSYSCENLPANKEHGGTYDFQMKGEDDVFKNLYLTGRGLASSFNGHGFALQAKKQIADRAYEGVRSDQPAFIQYAFVKYQ